MNRNGWVALTFHTLFIIFILAPIVVVCVVAFTPEGFLSYPTHTWSLRWFRAIADYPEFIDAFFASLWLGVLSSAIAVALSVPAALAIARHRFPGREAITALFLSPLMIPHVVLGIAFLTMLLATLAVIEAFSDTPEATDRRFDQQPLMDDPLDLLVPDGHRFAGRRRIRLSEAATEPWITGWLGTSCRDEVMAACTAAGSASTRLPSTPRSVALQTRSWNAVR